MVDFPRRLELEFSDLHTSGSPLFPSSPSALPRGPLPQEWRQRRSERWGESPGSQHQRGKVSRHRLAPAQDTGWARRRPQEPRLELVESRSTTASNKSSQPPCKANASFQALIYTVAEMDALVAGANARLFAWDNSRCVFPWFPSSRVCVDAQNLGVVASELAVVPPGPPKSYRRTKAVLRNRGPDLDPAPAGRRPSPSECVLNVPARI